ncbi:MAG: glycosyltransferase [Myxococcota bacterium]|nr:glycosyltransferase [Myxococcota bacterium]
MSNVPEVLEPRIRAARSAFDLTDPEHQESVRSLAELFLATGSETARRAVQALSGPLEARMAVLLADSRAWLLESRRPLRVGVVFAMWGEHHRLRPRSAENPHGEDCLATKLRQLDWATRGTRVLWRLHAVDDGCPHGSAEIAREVAAQHPQGEHVSILSLSEALPVSAGALRNLRSADDSRKAGAVMLGCEQAIAEGAEAVIYTDADSSVHLGQIGLLLRPFADGDARVVLGNRKHPESVLVKEAARWGIGIKVLRHMQRMIGHAIFSQGILDTQAAFKLYESQVLRQILADPTVYDFSFDTDWILAALRLGVPIEQVPFAFIDSAAESASIAQGPMTTWETLLFGLTKAVRRHGYCTGAAAEMASVLEDEVADHRDLERIIDRLPPELEDAVEADYGDPARMSPEALRAWLRETLAA